MLTPRELINAQKGFENCREAIGWDRDLMVHCHWEYDVRTSIEIAQAVETPADSWRPSESPTSRTSTASIRDYIALETMTGEGGWMDQVLVLDGPYIKDGFRGFFADRQRAHRAGGRGRTAGLTF